VRWDAYSLVVVRSTWNYHLHRDRFLAWAAKASGVTRVANALPVLRWNSHKSYLRNLAAAGVPVVPTELVPRGAVASLRDIGARNGWDDVVVKPAVSAGSWRTRRSRTADPEGERHLARLAADGDVLVQPYLQTVEERGERALVCVDGVLTHAVRKAPRFAGHAERVEGPVAVEPGERAVAQAALDHAGEGLLYGRVDLVDGPDGRPCVMELELVEPSLFLAYSAEAAQRFAKAIVRQASA
jgi:glutathione synthase/RimK-type ligase-like ATP-grasp enzyme